MRPGLSILVDLDGIVLGDPRLPHRFWSKVHVDPVTGCWQWTGYVGAQGYGVYNGGKKKYRAHRAATES